MKRYWNKEMSTSTEIPPCMPTGPHQEMMQHDPIRELGWGSVPCVLWSHLFYSVKISLRLFFFFFGGIVDWWLRQLRICLQCGRPRFDPWLGKIPWRRKWQPTPVSLPGESHGQRSLAGYSPWSRKKSDTAEQLTHFRSWISVYHSQVYNSDLQF